MKEDQTESMPCPFGGIEAEYGYEDARFVVLPIPYDGTSTWLKGADLGPAAILSASANMELYDIETDSEPWRQGIATLPPIIAGPGPESMVDAGHRTARRVFADRKILVGLGGEHSVSVGLIRACAEVHPGLTVLQLDAHSDTRASYEGSAYNHACVMARVGEICDFVQVGIRSMDAAERGIVPGENVFFAHELNGGRSWVAEVMDRLSGPVYVTIDLDVLDPSEMPSTGTPEPGGLSYRDLLALLKPLCRHFPVVGFDVVELMPNPVNRAPDFLAARLTYQMMAYIGLYDRGE